MDFRNLPPRSSIPNFVFAYVTGMTTRRTKERLRHERHLQNKLNRLDWVCPRCSQVFARYKNGPMRHARVCSLRSESNSAEAAKRKQTLYPAQHVWCESVEDIIAEIRASRGLPDEPVPIPSLNLDHLLQHRDEDTIAHHEFTEATAICDKESPLGFNTWDGSANGECDLPTSEDSPSSDDDKINDSDSEHNSN